MKLTLPTDSAARKRFPVRTGCFNYFPAALAGVASVSIDGNDKHNPGQPLHHARGKSSDHADCIDRHLTDVQDLLAYIRRHGHVNHGVEGQIAALLTEVNQLAWRALALSQEIHETYGGAPLAPAAKLDERPEGRMDNEWKKSPDVIEQERRMARQKDDLKKLYEQAKEAAPRKTPVEYPIRPYEPRPMDKVYTPDQTPCGTMWCDRPKLRLDLNDVRRGHLNTTPPNPQVPNGYSY